MKKLEIGTRVKIKGTGRKGYVAYKCKDGDFVVEIDSGTYGTYYAGNLITLKPKVKRREWWLMNRDGMLNNPDGRSCRSTKPSDSDKENWVHVREVK